MVPRLDRRQLLIALALCIVAVVALGPVLGLLPGFGEPARAAEFEVKTLERIESGCQDEVATYGRGTMSGSWSAVTFVPTRRADAALAAWAERTSPPGARLSTHRVHVETHAEGPANESCQTGILYRIEVATESGRPFGQVSDADGIRVLHVENGEYAGCSYSVSGSLNPGCHRFRSANRTWANATNAS